MPEDFRQERPADFEGGHIRGLFLGLNWGAFSSVQRLSQEEDEDPSLLSQTRGWLRQLGIRGGRRLGQHFLVNRGVLHQIVAAAELGPADTVIEVGPGLGLLTRELVKRAGRVVAIELDERLATALGQSLHHPPNLSIINADVLQVDPAELIAQPQVTGYKVVANLPYYITSPTLRHFLEARVKPSLLVVMVQQEVGQAIVAKPGEMSLLAISVQFYGQPRIVSKVPASCFFPRPKVDSVLLRIDVYSEPPVKVSAPSLFFNLVRAGFVSRRKQLRNSLAHGLQIAPQEAASLLEQAGIDPRRRAETLSLEDWARLESRLAAG
jgi:16S rRNA (adenine1518-N6/adenine1519-N6)-dimethyltransferase